MNILVHRLFLFVKESVVPPFCFAALGQQHYFFIVKYENTGTAFITSSTGVIIILLLIDSDCPYRRSGSRSAH